MDEITRQIIGQISGLAIQSIFTYMAQAGLSSDEIDVLFEIERKEFKRKHPSTLPSPNSKPLPVTTQPTTEKPKNPYQT